MSVFSEYFYIPIGQVLEQTGQVLIVYLAVAVYIAGSMGLLGIGLFQYYIFNRSIAVYGNNSVDRRISAFCYTERISTVLNRIK